MRKVIVSMNVTSDGFMADRHDGLEWHFPYWNNDLAEESCRLLAGADTLLLGRKTYQAMAGYWPFRSNDVSFPRGDIALSEMMNNYRKIVFSTTLKQLLWQNSELRSSCLEFHILSLKQQPGKDILVYGSGSIAGCLKEAGLVDEYQIWLHPVHLGSGKHFLKIPDDIKALTLLHRKLFSTGVELFILNASPGIPMAAEVI